MDATSNVLIADNYNNRIRMVSPDGTISTVAGSGEFGITGDGGPSTSAQLAPFRVAVMEGANLVIGDTANHRVRRVAKKGRGQLTAY